jgi:hypothetical protein
VNVSALIDAIVRQTTVLIAELATVGGGRAQLAHTANQVFLDLVEALKEQGVGSKVIADMFGLALRTYQEKLRRLSESRSVRGRSLWEVVLEHVQTSGPLLKAEILTRFKHDDPASVRGVLKDLVESGLIYRTGRGDRSAFKAASLDELRLRADPQGSAAILGNLVWVAVQRLRPASVDDLVAALSIDAERVHAALTTLSERGLVQVNDTDGVARYDCRECVMSYDDPRGWEAAVFDHYQAMVTALTLKLQQGRTQARRDDTIGGSTFGFEVWPGHPHLDEVTGFLGELRRRGSALREKVAGHNRGHAAPANEKIRVITYVGQAVVPQGAAVERDGTVDAAHATENES